MVMLDRVGIPSGVQVKKPPMIFIVHPDTVQKRRERQGGFQCGVSLSPLPYEDQ